MFNPTPNNSERGSQYLSNATPSIVDTAPDTPPMPGESPAVFPIPDVVEPTRPLDSQAPSVPGHGGDGIGAIVGIGGKGGDIITNVTNICEHCPSSNLTLTPYP
jgi:hypothetical protein